MRVNLKDNFSSSSLWVIGAPGVQGNARNGQTQEKLDTNLLLDVSSLVTSHVDALEISRCKPICGLSWSDAQYFQQT